MRYFPSGTFRRERNYRSFDAEHYRCDLPTDVSLWPGLPLSLSGDEVMPLDYHAGRSGWLLYGRGPDKQRLTQYQTKLGAAMVIVAARCVEDYRLSARRVL